MIWVQFLSSQSAHFFKPSSNPFCKVPFSCPLRMACLTSVTSVLLDSGSVWSFNWLPYVNLISRLSKSLKNMTIHDHKFKSSFLIQLRWGFAFSMRTSESYQQMWHLSGKAFSLEWLSLLSNTFTLQKQVYVRKLKLELRITHHLFFGNNVKAYFFYYDKKKREEKDRCKLISI